MSVATYTQDSPVPAPGGAWQDLALSIIGHLHDHATFIKEEERDGFTRELADVLRALRDQPSESGIALTTETLKEKIPQYFRETQKEIDSSLSELRQLTSVLMATLTQIHEADHSTMASLTEIGQIVQAARSPGELAVAKIHLVQALDRLRTHTEERREANEQLLSALQEKARALELAPALEASLQVGTTTPKLPTEESLALAIGSADPVTGLLGRAAAEAFLISLADRAKLNTYIVAFYVQRMELINSRFGDRMGTDVLCYCAQYFAKLVQPSDQLFRWRGPGFVAALARGRSVSDVKHEVNSALRTRMTFERADNSVIIPLAIVSQMWPAREAHAAEMIHNIETFFSLPSTRASLDGSSGGKADGVEDDTAEEA